MSTLELLLVGALGFIVYKAVTKESVSLSIDAMLESYITPFNPGVMQKGWLKLINDSDKTVNIVQLMFRISDKQVTQSGKEISTGRLLNNKPLSLSIIYDNKYFHKAAKDDERIIITPADLDLSLIAHSSLTFGMNVTVVKYEPAGNPIVVSDDFDRGPFNLNIDVEVTLSNGDVMKLTMPVQFSNVKEA